MKKTAILVIIITIASKFMGLLRDVILSYIYGASNISDAYIISSSIPLILFSFVGVGLVTSYIPIYTTIQQQEDTEQANRFTSNLVNFTILILSFIVIIVFINSNFIVKLFASGFEGDTLKLASNFVKISIFGIYFTTLVHIFGAYSQIKNNYIAPSIMVIIMNVVSIISIYLSSIVNIYILPFGVVISIISQIFILIPVIRSKGYKHKIFINFKDKYLLKMIYLSIPVVLGTSVNQINQLVDRTLASRIVVGGISALNYSSKIGLLIQGIFVMSITGMIYPQMSMLSSKNDAASLKKVLMKTVNIITLLVIPSSIGIMFFSEQLVEVLFGRGAFGSTEIQMTTNALFYYTIGMFGFALREIFSKVFYSLHDTRTPMINSAIGMVSNIVLNILLSRFMGISGLALATSISSYIIVLLMAVNLRRRIGNMFLLEYSKLLMKVISVSLITILAANYLYDLLIMLIESTEIVLILVIMVSVVVYTLLVLFMKISEIDDITNFIRRKYQKMRS